MRRAEHAARPTEVRAQGAGWLLAEAAAGVGHGLHSRAPLLLAALLAEDALPLSALRSASGQVRFPCAQTVCKLAPLVLWMIIPMDSGAVLTSMQPHLCTCQVCCVLSRQKCDACASSLAFAVSLNFDTNLLGTRFQVTWQPVPRGTGLCSF